MLVSNDVGAGELRDVLLIVEDEPRLANHLREASRANGFAALHTSCGKEAIDVAQRHLPALILLDWAIEGISGIEVCRRLGSRPETRSIPIIMISGKGDEDDRIHALNSGADDYLVKPVSTIELFARIRALLRRRRPLQDPERLVVGDLVLDTAAMRVSRMGHNLVLRSRELQLLRVLMARPGEVLSAERLRLHVWGERQDVSLWSVAQTVHRLRKALQHGGLPDPVRTVRGQGYALEGDGLVA